MSKAQQKSDKNFEVLQLRLQKQAQEFLAKSRQRLFEVNGRFESDLIDLIHVSPDVGVHYGSPMHRVKKMIGKEVCRNGTNGFGTPEKVKQMQRGVSEVKTTAGKEAVPL